MARRGVLGVGSLRRILRQLPDEVRKGLAGELAAIGGRLLARAKSETPVRTGRLKAALAFKVSPKTLMLWLGLITRADRRRRFYGFILDQGRSAKVVTIKRGPRAGHVMRIPSIGRERYNFVFGRRRDFKENELHNMRRVVDSALRRLARSSGND